MLIAITGGIGSGKSVVSQALQVMGFKVYDCDSRAKWVMTHDQLLRDELINLFGAETFLPDGTLNKPHLSAVIFSNTDLLAKMNACVHPAVARDLKALYTQHLTSEDASLPYFFESAILFESGFDALSLPDEVWTVSAPLETRIIRAMRRDNTTRETILNRINNQISQEEKESRATHVIWNDPEHSILEQVRAIIGISSSTPENTEVPPA